MSGATEVSESEKYFFIQLETVRMIFENDTDEGAQYERQWHDEQDEILSSRIKEYTPQVKAEIDSIINNDNDKFGIIEYSEDIENVPYDYDKIVANADRPYREIWISKDETDDSSGDIPQGFYEKEYLDETDDTSGDDVLFAPGVKGAYRYKLTLSGISDNEYLNDYYTSVTVALKLGISAGVRKELTTRLANSIKGDDTEFIICPR